MRAFRTGYYHPTNPEKYVGDVNKIVYRSSWELRAFRFFDNNIKVLRWSSEEIKIKYISPLDQAVHTYYPDCYVEYINPQGEVVKEVVEIKPANQTKIPTRSRGKRAKTLLHEQATYVVNQAKWEAAIKWCNERGLTFRVITEHSLFK